MIRRDDSRELDHWARALAMVGVLAAGCAAPAPRVPTPVEAAPRPLWELAPEGAAAGLVVHDGTLGRGLDLLETLRVHDPDGAPAFDVRSTLSKVFGVDVTRGMAVFAWPQKDRGLLVVMPLRDGWGKAKRTRDPGSGAAIDDVGNGYVCMRAAGRYVCARSVAEIEAAVAPHDSALARQVARLPPEDRGEIELFATPRASAVAHLREQARPLGLLTGVAAAVRLRPDGAAARLRFLGAMETATAKALAAGPTSPALAPAAGGASTVVRAHFDPRAVVPPSAPVDARTRSELIEQLAGDVEITTSGGGVAGASLIAPLRDAARAERFVKERCAEAGGSIRRRGLDRITVTEHGCSARFDPILMLWPVSIRPIPISITVDQSRIVVLVGEAHEPTSAERAWETLVEGAEAKRALTGSEALVVLSRRPVIGPDVAAARAFKEMIPFVDDRAASIIDFWSDVGAHIYQTLLTVQVRADGVTIAGDFTTFAADPPDARAAYEDALRKRARGDDAGYRAALADVERRFPGTRAARRAAETRASAPYVGAGVLAIAALAGLLGGP